MTRMWKRLAVCGLVLMALPLMASSELSAATFKAKADSLCEGIQGRAEKVEVLHKFVRDQIAEVATRFT